MSKQCTGTSSQGNRHRMRLLCFNRAFFHTHFMDHLSRLCKKNPIDDLADVLTLIASISQARRCLCTPRYVALSFSHSLGVSFLNAKLFVYQIRYFCWTRSFMSLFSMEKRLLHGNNRCFSFILFIFTCYLFFHVSMETTGLSKPRRAC